MHEHEAHREGQHLVRGEVYPEADGSAWIRMDLANIQWMGQGTSDPYRVHNVLMRFGLLAPLAAAYRETHDERFARSTRAYLEAFLRTYPVREDWQPAPEDGPTSYPNRIGWSRDIGWLGALPTFLESPAFDDAFFEQIVGAARAWILYLTTHVYPGRNIRILHGDVLLVSGLRLSFLPEAAAWRAQGARILNVAIA